MIDRTWLIHEVIVKQLPTHNGNKTGKINGWLTLLENPTSSMAMLMEA